MNRQTVYCEECLEEIPNGEMFWDDKRLYCGRCGSELDVGTDSPDIFEEITAEKAKRLVKLEDEDYEDEDDDEYFDDEDDDEDDDYAVGDDLIPEDIEEE